MQSRFSQSWSYLQNHPTPAPTYAGNPSAGLQRSMFHHYHRRGPSRIFWFLVGGGVFAWWSHARERRLAVEQGKAASDWYPSWGWTGAGAGAGHRCANKWGRERWIDNGPNQQAPVPLVVAGSASAVVADEKAPAPTQTPPAPQPQADMWEGERRKIMQVGQQATEAATDIAELSLDGVLSAVEGLRAKLAEFRETRDQQRARSQSEPTRPAEPERRV